jgi:pimeloyl-ACP methyl ester carboxylesterase
VRAWDNVLPFLEPCHDVVALTALGHRGGAAASSHPVCVRDLVDDTERALDERGLDQPHVAGNSLGGWMAIELARRGRARSVCALSPAGMWSARTAEQTSGVRKIRRTVREARLGRPAPFLMRSASVRRVAFRHAAVHGDRLTSSQAVDATADLLECTITDHILRTDDEVEPLDPLPCPVTLAWSGEDAIVPLEVNGAVARRRLPQARFVVLAGVGHVPMIDDPQLVARAILESTAADAQTPCRS